MMICIAHSPSGWGCFSSAAGWAVCPGNGTRQLLDRSTVKGWVRSVVTEKLFIYWRPRLRVPAGCKQGCDGVCHSVIEVGVGGGGGGTIPMPGVSTTRLKVIEGVCGGGGGGGGTIPMPGVSTTRLKVIEGGGWGGGGTIPMPGVSTTRLKVIEGGVCGGGYDSHARRVHHETESDRGCVCVGGGGVVRFPCQVCPPQD